MDKIYDLVIIGGGPAGYTAAMYAARGGLDTVIVERLAAGGQMGLTDTVDNYPGFDEGIDGFTLGMKMHRQSKSFDSYVRRVYLFRCGIPFEESLHKASFLRVPRNSGGYQNISCRSRTFGGQREEMEGYGLVRFVRNSLLYTAVLLHRRTSRA